MNPDPATPRRVGSRWAGVIVAPVLYCATLVFLRGRPYVRSDGGIFVSGAASLVRGDRLYSGVWDNKSPFFYYAQALAFAVSGWRGPFLLDVVWISVAAFSMRQLFLTRVPQRGRDGQQRSSTRSFSPGLGTTRVTQSSHLSRWLRRSIGSRPVANLGQLARSWPSWPSFASTTA
jgi:hypothetical protein